jgi:sugar/nucleoside kinase (ribokinase family)
MWVVAAAADMCVDLILRGDVRPRFHQIEQVIDDYCLEMGGSANIFASQMAKLGARAGVIGAVGGDAFGAFLLQRLREAGIDTARVRTDTALRTGLGVALAEPHERAILTYLGTIDASGPEDLPAAPETLCRHWHVASYFLLGRLRESWPAFLERCRRGGVTTSLDPNWDPGNRWAEVRSLLPLVDVFLPNEAEAAAISGEADAADAGRALSRLGPLVVVKRGGRGPLAMRGAEMWELPPNCDAPPAIVDTMGAGDNFDAGFLRAWLLGIDVTRCLELGHRCAVSSLGAPGGVRGQLREQLQPEEPAGNSHISSRRPR